MLPATPAQKSLHPFLPVPVHRAEVAAGHGDRSSWGGGHGAQMQTGLEGMSILFPQGLNNSLGLFAASAEQNLHPASITCVGTTQTSGRVLDLCLR